MDYADCTDPISADTSYCASLILEEIVEFCREKLAAYKAPKIVEFRDELPKSAVGKILRKLLRAEALEKAEQK